MGCAIRPEPNTHVLKDLESYISPPLIRVRLLRTNKGKQTKDLLGNPTISSQTDRIAINTLLKGALHQTIRINCHHCLTVLELRLRV